MYVNLSAQCTAVFTRVNTPNCNCVTFVPSSNSRGNSVDNVNYGDNQTESILNRSVFSHCYLNPGTYTIRRTVRTNSGQNCAFFQPVTITSCCPTIQGISIIGASNDPLGTPCSRGFKESDTTIQSTNSLLGQCYYKFSAALSTTNLTGFTYGWNFGYLSNGSFVQTCNVPNTTIANAPAYLNTPNTSFYVQFYLGSSSCPSVVFQRKVTTTTLACNYNLQLKNSDTENDFYPTFLNSNPTSGTGLIFYPNPVNNSFTISNTLDIENAQFELQNILGQKLLSERLNSNETQVDMSNISKGIYIGVIKSNGKVIHTEKIYKE